MFKAAIGLCQNALFRSRKKLERFTSIRSESETGGVVYASSQENPNKTQTIFQAILPTHISLAKKAS